MGKPLEDKLHCGAVCILVWSGDEVVSRKALIYVMRLGGWFGMVRSVVWDGIASWGA